jgi:hypothetical protein
MQGWLKVPPDAKPGLWTLILLIDGIEQRRGTIAVTAE